MFSVLIVTISITIILLFPTVVKTKLHFQVLLKTNFKNKFVLTGQIFFFPFQDILREMDAKGKVDKKLLAEVGIDLQL